MEKLDLTRYLGIIYRAINDLNVPTHVRDEAYSEGLVVLARAAGSFDPDTGIRPGTWFTLKVRYGLLTWLETQRRHETVSLDDIPYEPADDTVTDTDEYAYFTQVIETSLTVLTHEEHLAVMGHAYGLRREELRLSLGTTDRRLKYLRSRGRKKLRYQLGLL